MHNYLLFESMLQVKVVPVEKLKPSMWVGANKPFRKVEWQKLERERHNRVSEFEQEKLHVVWQCSLLVETLRSFLVCALDVVMEGH